MKRTQYRQGDVLLIRAAHRRTSEAKPVDRDRGRLVLAYGEATGHAHAIDATLAELFEEKDGRLYLRLDEPAALTHEEHAPIDLEPGLYRVIHQREYSPEAIRRVSD
jgi:hypothetical protein